MFKFWQFFYQHHTHPFENSTVQYYLKCSKSYFEHINIFSPVSMGGWLVLPPAYWSGTKYDFEHLRPATPRRSKAVAAAVSWLPEQARLSSWLTWQTAAPGRAWGVLMVRAQLGTLGHTAQKWEGSPGSLTHSINRLNNSRNLTRINRGSRFPAPAAEGLFSVLGEQVFSHIHFSPHASVLALYFGQEAEPSSSCFLSIYISTE